MNTKNHTANRLIQTGLCALATAIMAPAIATADEIFSSSFNGTAETTPANFSVSSSLKLNGNGAYRMTAGENALSYYNASGSLSLTDYTVDAAFTFAGNIGNIGLVGRYTDTTNYYVGRLVRDGTSGWYLQIYRFASSGGNGAVAQSTESFSYSMTGGGGTYYEGRLEFTLVGDSLKLELYSQQSGGTVLQSITATDASLASGTAGVRASIGNGSAISYQDFAINTPSIPEPATIAFLMAAALFAITISIQTKRKSTV